MLHRGLPIVLDCITYTILSDSGKKSLDYDIGGIFCEYIRNKPIEFKDIIIKAPFFKNKYSEKKLLESMEWIKGELSKEFPPSSVMMLVGSMLTIIEDTIDFNEKEHIKEETDYQKEFEFYEDLKKRVFAGSGVENNKYDCIGSIIMNAYFKYIFHYGIARSIAERVIPFFEKDADFDDEKLKEFPVELFTNCLSLQHIDYNIVSMEGGLKPIFTPRTPLSLFIFEISNMLEYGSELVKCKNCGKYFVPRGRNDAKYCLYDSPQNPGKTCKDVGAQLSRAKKERQDELTREYRKKYMSLLMRTKRHPDNEKYERAFKKYKSEIIKIRKQFEEQRISKEAYIEWIKSFK